MALDISLATDVRGPVQAISATASTPSPVVTAVSAQKFVVAAPSSWKASKASFPAWHALTTAQNAGLLTIGFGGTTVGLLTVGVGDGGDGGGGLGLGTTVTQVSSSLT